MDRETLRTGEVAAKAGVNVQALRYYERRGLLEEPERRASGYREYSPDAVRLIRFIKRAQELGFTLNEIEDLLRLRGAQGSHCSEVHEAAELKIEDIEHGSASTLLFRKETRMVVRMLNRRLLLALVLTSAAELSSCRNDSRSGEANAASAQENTREAVFRVEGMTCASCNVTVKVAAEKVRGVLTARADSAEGRAWVTFDPVTTNPNQIAAAISETGYKATPLDGPEAAPSSSAADTHDNGVSAQVACRVLRDGVYRLWPEFGRAPRPREIAKALSMTEPDVHQALDALSSRELPCGRIERASRSDRIVFAWPLSNVPTEYIIKIPGSKPVYGRCAIDALGVSAMYGKPVEIEATSVSSGAPIRISVHGSRVERAEPADAVVWVAGEDCGCDEMVIFANRAELAEWRRTLGKPEGRTLSLDEATAYGVRVFGNRLRVN